MENVPTTTGKLLNCVYVCVCVLLQDWLHCQQGPVMVQAQEWIDAGRLCFAMLYVA